MWFASFLIPSAKVGTSAVLRPHFACGHVGGQSDTNISPILTSTLPSVFLLDALDFGHCYVFLDLQQIADQHCCMFPFWPEFVESLQFLGLFRRSCLHKFGQFPLLPRSQTDFLLFCYPVTFYWAPYSCPLRGDMALLRPPATFSSTAENHDPLLLPH